MKQKEIWMVDLNPTIGSEQSGIRPVVILSGNALNDHMPVVIIAPLSSKIKNYKGHPVLSPDKINGLKTVSEILLFQINSISKIRFQKKIGEVSEETLKSCLTTINELFYY